LVALEGRVGEGWLVCGIGQGGLGGLVGRQEEGWLVWLIDETRVVRLGG
jgi:hypothetical protein